MSMIINVDRELTGYFRNEYPRDDSERVVAK